MSRTNLVAAKNALFPWQLIYIAAGSETQEAFRCQADNAEHAIEQLREAEPEAAVTSVVRVDAVAIAQEGETDFCLAEGATCWITSRNASIKIHDAHGSLCVDILPYGCEMGVGHQVMAPYSDLAWDALLADGESPEKIRDCVAALQDHHVAAHLAAIDPRGRAKVRAALGYAILVPTCELGVDPASAIVAALPLDASAERVLIHYESNRYGAENMHRFVEKLYHAADRADTGYPTIAKSSVKPAEVKVVGWFSHAERRIVEISDPDALKAWVGEIGDHQL